MIKDMDYQKIPFTAFVNDDNKHMCSPEALDLLSKMLQYDKNERINCKEAMAHPYFDPVREFVTQGKNEK